MGALCQAVDLGGVRTAGQPPRPGQSFLIFNRRSQATSVPRGAGVFFPNFVYAAAPVFAAVALHCCRPRCFSAIATSCLHGSRAGFSAYAACLSAALLSVTRKFPLRRTTPPKNHELSLLLPAALHAGIRRHAIARGRDGRTRVVRPGASRDQPVPAQTARTRLGENAGRGGHRPCHP